MSILTRCILGFFIGTIYWAGHTVRADDLDPTMTSIVFNGRWDLRNPAHAITVNSGSYFRAQFSGASLAAEFDLSINQAPLPTIAWKIDDGKWQESEIGKKVQLADHLSDGAHSVWLMVRGIDEHQNRWTAPLIGSVNFIGLDIDPSGKMMEPLQAWVNPKLKLEFIGDSITEGVLVQPGGVGPGKTSWPWQTEALHSYACQTAMRLDAAWRQVGFGATGLTHGGSGGAPSAFETFNYFYAGCPRDNWQPDVVIINEGTNDSSVPVEQYLPAYSKFITLVRQGYPQAKIACLRPFGGYEEAAIKQAVDKARADGDSAVYYIDSTGWYAGGSGLHPSATFSGPIADKLAAALKSQVLNP